jgi:hypothetical protein
MGNELNCVARIDGKTDRGKALLETSELIFRGAECRVKIHFSEMRGVRARDGELRFKTKDGEFGFAVGQAAGKWREKILHPKTRLEKLGVRAGMEVAVIGEPEARFAKELAQNNVRFRKSDAQPGAGLVSWFVDGKRALQEAG